MGSGRWVKETGANTSAGSQAKSAVHSTASSAVASEVPSAATSAESAASETSRTAKRAAKHHAAKSVARQTPKKATSAANSAATPVSKKATSQAEKASQAPADVQPARRSEKRAAQSAADTKAKRRATSDATSQPATPAHQPKIAVRGTERDDNEEQPELPLSREELYGDQQPNGGQAPDKQTAEPMSRLARHAEEANDELSEETPTESNPHLKKKSTGEKKSHYSWKLMATGVAVLLIAAVGALFMWNRAKTTQADAKTNAETIVRAIYTSSAQRDLRSSATDDQLQQLQTNIDAMKSSDEKDSLQKQYDYAKKMMTVRTSYQKLRNVSGLINTDVTAAAITKDRQAIKTAGLTDSKAFFAKKYDQKYATTAIIVKKVTRYDQAFKKLYNKKNKLKSTTLSSDVDTVMSNLKKYRGKSQLAANDYNKLKADRKKLAKAESSSAAAASSSSYSESSSSYSEPESSSSSSEYSSSDDSSSSTYYSSSTTDSTYNNGGNDTATSSAASSSSTTHHYSSSTTTGTTDGTGTSNGTTTGNGTTNGTTNDTTTNNN